MLLICLCVCSLTNTDLYNAGCTHTVHIEDVMRDDHAYKPANAYSPFAGSGVMGRSSVDEWAQGRRGAKGFRPGNEPRTIGCHTVLTARACGHVCVYSSSICAVMFKWSIVTFTGKAWHWTSSYFVFSAHSVDACSKAVKSLAHTLLVIKEVITCSFYFLII